MLLVVCTAEISKQQVVYDGSVSLSCSDLPCVPALAIGVPDTGERNLLSHYQVCAGEDLVDDVLGVGDGSPPFAGCIRAYFCHLPSPVV